MVNSWSLLDSEINGTMDEDYPIMYGPDDEEKYVTNKKEEGKSDYYFDYDRNGDMPSPFSTLSDNDDQMAHHIAGGMGEDHISISGTAGTAYDDPKYYASAVDFAVDSMGSSTKPQPDLKYKSHKYQEDKGIADLRDYVSSTYKGHYTNENSDTQTLDLIHSVGDAESFCRSNALKYLSRYDKKGTAKNDILKAMHYCLLLYYFSGNTKEPEYTNTRYETF